MPNALISSERDRHKGKEYVVCQGLVLLILFLDVWTESQWRGISLTYQSNTDPQFSPSSSLAVSHHIVRPLHIFRYSCAHTFLFLFLLSIGFFFLFVVILSYIEMKQPWVYMCSPSQSPLPPPSPPAPSRSSQCTRSERLSHASNLDWWSVSP